MVISLENRKVTIRHTNDGLVEGVVLARNEYKMRVAVQGASDAAVFVFVDGSWISEDCEPVDITFEWRRQPKPNQPVTLANCICPKQLAARLIQTLETGDEDGPGAQSS
jgi:hypothetical protein